MNSSEKNCNCQGKVCSGSDCPILLAVVSRLDGRNKWEYFFSFKPLIRRYLHTRTIRTILSQEQNTTSPAMGLNQPHLPSPWSERGGRAGKRKTLGTRLNSYGSVWSPAYEPSGGSCPCIFQVFFNVSVGLPAQ